MGGDEASCGQKVFASLALSAPAGAMFGAINAAWINKPAVKEQSGPLLRMTMSTIRNHAVLFAAVGGIFTATECTAATIRGKQDAYNSVVAGCTAGAVLGFYVGRPSVAVGGCAAMAGMMAAVEIAGGRFGPHPMTPSALAPHSEEEH